MGLETKRCVEEVNTRRALLGEVPPLAPTTPPATPPLAAAAPPEGCAWCPCCDGGCQPKWPPRRATEAAPGGAFATATAATAAGLPLPAASASPAPPLPLTSATPATPPGDIPPQLPAALLAALLAGTLAALACCGGAEERRGSWPPADEGTGDAYLDDTWRAAATSSAAATAAATIDSVGDAMRPRAVRAGVGQAGGRKVVAGSVAVAALPPASSAAHTQACCSKKASWVESKLTPGVALATAAATVPGTIAQSGLSWLHARGELGALFSGPSPRRAAAAGDVLRERLPGEEETACLASVAPSRRGLCAELVLDWLAPLALGGEDARGASVPLLRRATPFGDGCGDAVGESTLRRRCSIVRGDVAQLGLGVRAALEGSPGDSVAFPCTELLPDGREFCRRATLLAGAPLPCPLNSLPEGASVCLPPAMVWEDRGPSSELAPTPLHWSSAWGWRVARKETATS